MYLKEIIEHKQEEIRSMSILDKERNKGVLNPLDFLPARPFITEIKKASPSMGDINTGIDIIRQARLYEKGGAGSISVLTDERYFKGDINFLSQVSEKIGLPVLCKDFIISEMQIENAYLAGADIILLIAAILRPIRLRELTLKARSMGLTVLHELHDYAEFNKIKNLDLQMVGVNSRDLTTFKIDKKKAMTSLGKLQGNFLKVAESGISEAGDIRQFMKSGADTFLIGTSLMTASDPVMKLREFYGALV